MTPFGGQETGIQGFRGQDDVTCQEVAKRGCNELVLPCLGGTRSVSDITAVIPNRIALSYSQMSHESLFPFHMGGPRGHRCTSPSDPEMKSRLVLSLRSVNTSS